MAFLDMFDKLDDIIYAPVNSICEWTKEPLRRWEHKREMDTRQHEAEVEAYSAREAAKLEVDTRRWHEEINELIAENQQRRNEELVESLKRYQMDVANTTKDIVESLGQMSLDLRERANNLLQEKTREYKAIQDEAKKQSIEELAEAKEMFGESDPETYRMMVSTIMAERKAMIDIAQNFMKELAEDFKRLNQNTDALLKMGMDNVNKYLSPIANQLSAEAQIQSSFASDNHQISGNTTPLIDVSK